MVDVSSKTYEKNCVATILDNDGILWLDEKHRRRIRYKNLQMTIGNIFQTIEKIDVNE